MKGNREIQEAGARVTLTQVVRAPVWEEEGTSGMRQLLETPIALASQTVQVAKPMIAVCGKMTGATQSANTSIFHPEGTASPFASSNTIISSTSIEGSEAIASAPC